MERAEDCLVAALAEPFDADEVAVVPPGAFVIRLQLGGFEVSRAAAPLRGVCCPVLPPAARTVLA